MAKKTWVKELVIDDRQFRITFWRDSWGLMWTCIEERIWTPRRFSNKYRKDFIRIKKYWTEEDPIETADQEITNYLLQTKKEKEFEKALDNWCK